MHALLAICSCGSCHTAAVRVILTVPDMLVLWLAALFAALHTEPIQGASADCGYKYSSHSWTGHLENMAGACFSLRARP